MSAEVTLGSSFAELLGGRTTPEASKRQRWAAWLRLARKHDRRLAAEWARDLDRCSDCARRRGGWCKTAALPCNVNPILSFRMGMPGFACMGMGFVPRQLQIDFGVFSHV